MNTRDFLGQTVTVTMDRPLGTVHPKYPHIHYSVNYGFIADTISGDGEELDAYLLGVDVPLPTFEGEVIAVIHRTSEDDDKLVVVPQGMRLSDDDIRAATEFQEKFFTSVIWRSEEEQTDA